MTVTTFEISIWAQDATATYTHTAWPPSGGTFANSDSVGVVYPKKTFTGGQYYANVGLFRWDTSSIPDGDTITSARLLLYCVDLVGDANNMGLVGDYYDFGGAPSVAADWIETISPSIFTAVDLSTISELVDLAIPLTDLSGINKTGWTGIRIGLTAGTPTGLNEVNFREFTNSHPGYYARLEVTHSAVTLDTALPDADISTAGWSTAPLYSKINDASDATVIQATAS